MRNTNMHLVFLTLLFSACSGVEESDFLRVEFPSPAIGEGKLLESVGLETLGGVLAPLLAAGCDLPCEETQSFSTAADGQTEINLSLFRGKTDLVKDAHPLGDFTIHGIPDAPRGAPQIFVTLRAAAEGISISCNGGPNTEILIRRSIE